MNVSGGAPGVTVSIQTVAQNLGGTLRLAAEVLREPAFPESEFETLRNATLANFENARQQPESPAQLTLMRHLNPYPEDDVRYVRSIEEQIAATKKANLEDANKFYRDFYGASNGVITSQRGVYRRDAAQCG